MKDMKDHPKGTVNDEAVDILYAQLGSLPDPEFGHINLLPFAQDSPDVNVVKRRVCESIVRVFRDAGFPLVREAPVSDPPRRVEVKCQACGSLLLGSSVNADGVASVPAAHTLSSLARLGLECPHKPVTLEDQRQKIEQALQEANE